MHWSSHRLYWTSVLWSEYTSKVRSPDNKPSQESVLHSWISSRFLAVCWGFFWHFHACSHRLATEGSTKPLMAVFKSLRDSFGFYTRAMYARHLHLTLQWIAKSTLTGLGASGYVIENVGIVERLWTCTRLFHFFPEWPLSRKFKIWASWDCRYSTFKQPQVRLAHERFIAPFKLLEE